VGIRKTSKDHLREHAGVALVLQEPLRVPESDDPLVFWTRHPKGPCKVDLREFAIGKTETVTGHTMERLFTGRPGLIAQLTPAIRDSLVIAASDTVVQAKNALRQWWFVLDEVESSAVNAGKPMERVDDVRQLTVLQEARAHQAGMARTPFGKFRALADSTRVALGAKPTYWKSPGKRESEKHIPPDEQRKSVRLAIKYECRRVLRQWEIFRDLEKVELEPTDPETAASWRAVRHMRSTQDRTGSLIPTGDDLDRIGDGGHHDWCNRKVGRVADVRSTAFPDKRQALAVFTQCMATTGWNAAVMLSLDLGHEFLIDHPKDQPDDPHRRWVLVGKKERAGGAEQYAFGQWKSLDLPGHLIKTYLARVEPLRGQLRAEMSEVQSKYDLHHEANPSSKETEKLFKRLAWLRQAHNSVWLYVDRYGKLDVLDDVFKVAGSRENEGEHGVTFLDELVAELNQRRQSEGKEEVPDITYGDFRIWFADYLYRSSFGNLLVVQLGLNHGEIRTSQRYVNTNMINHDAENDARQFMEILTDEMDRGRIDLTILAHLMRHGALTLEQEEKLAALRTLPRSRQGVGCRDPRLPPKHLKATPGQACDAQRCLLCPDHAVLLPESLPGIAMREAELLALQLGLPAGSFYEELYDVELQNQQAALLQFDPVKVSDLRVQWAKAINAGQHIVPGMLGVIRIFEERP